MAEIHSISGCTAEIWRELHRLGRRELQSFPEVEILDREYSNNGSV